MVWLSNLIILRTDLCVGKRTVGTRAGGRIHVFEFVLEGVLDYEFKRVCVLCYLPLLGPFMKGNHANLR